MLNSINSYSNYNYTNSLNNESSKTKALDKENSNTNLNQRNLTNTSNQVNNNTILSLKQVKDTNNTTQLTTSNTKQINNTKEINLDNALNLNTSKLVSDKSQAVDKVLGYGVDKEGFFTSDFNEAAGLPKDYRIYAKGMENLVNYTTSLEANPTGRVFTSIDIAKSLGRAYQVFSQLAPKVERNFTQEDINNIPQWFQWNEQTLEVTKTYTKEQYISVTSARNKESAYNVLKDDLSFPSLNKLSIDFIDKNADIFEPSRKFNIGEDIYKNADNTISKGGVLMAFFAGSQNIGFFRGETTISGKLAGLDDNFSIEQTKELVEFMENNPISYSITGDIGKDLINLLTLTDKFTNVDEFKQEWLKMKAQRENQNAGFSFSFLFNSLENNKATDENKIKEKTFKPIQGESKNKTYTNNYMNETLKKLLENKQLLEMLFGIKANDDTDNVNFNKILSQMGLNKSIDIKV